MLCNNNNSNFIYVSSLKIYWWYRAYACILINVGKQMKNCMWSKECELICCLHTSLYGNCHTPAKHACNWHKRENEISFLQTSEPICCSDHAYYNHITQMSGWDLRGRSSKMRCVLPVGSPWHVFIRFACGFAFTALTDNATETLFI